MGKIVEKNFAEFFCKFLLKVFRTLISAEKRFCTVEMVTCPRFAAVWIFTVK